MYEEQLLRAIFQMTARQVFSEEKLLQILVPKGAGATQVAAYNKCDGTKTQSEIVKDLGLDQGNFSRTLARWIDAGIVIRLGDKSDCKLLHIYPLLKEHSK